MGHCALVDVLKTCYRISNASQTVLEKDVDRVQIAVERFPAHLPGVQIEAGWLGVILQHALVVTSRTTILSR